MNKDKKQINIDDKKLGYGQWIRSFFSRSEVTTFILMAIVLAVLLITTPNYRDVSFIIRAISRNMEFGLIALMLTFIIIAGMIDLSVASIMTLSATVAGLVYHNAGLPMLLAIIIGLAVGLALGMINGALVAYAGIQSIIVTIATLSLYRGISTIFIGDHSLGGFPEWFNRVDRIYPISIGDIQIPVTIIGFLIIAIIMFLILKFTSTGRKIYSLGTNETVAKFSGLNVKKMRFLMFCASGLFSAAAGILTMSRLLVVRHDMALVGELDIVTIVVLGGTSIAGGKGNIIGTLWGLMIVIFVRTGLSVAGIPVDQQLFIIGLILLLAVAVPDVISLVRERYLTRKVQRSLREDIESGK